MSYTSSSAQVSSLDRTLAGLLAAGIMFVAGYTAVRMAMAQPAADAANATYPVAPHEATLWANGFTSL
ncbi:MAG: hypothetical protein AAFZ80_14380 [Cyanobacteria bacterium P01_A01_bin.105]